jgi:uncharacterized protein YkwD
MNIIDILLILIILFSVWSGYQKGFIADIVEFAGWIATLYLLFAAYPYLAKFADKHLSSPGIITYGFIFLISIFLIRSLVDNVLVSLVRDIPSNTYRHPLNAILGVLPGFVNGVIYAMLVTALLFMVPFWPAISKQAEESKVGKKLDVLIDGIEKKIPAGLLDSVQISLSKMKMETGSAELVNLDFKVNNAKVRPDLEAEMLILVNQERAKNGLKPVTADPEMTLVARKHSTDMFVRGYFSHYTPEKKSPFDRMRDDNIKYFAAGENLALAPTLAMAHRGLMQSPGHRANILRPAFGRLGIGIMDGGRYGIMVTQSFRN